MIRSPDEKGGVVSASRPFPLTLWNEREKRSGASVIGSNVHYSYGVHKSTNPANKGGKIFLRKLRVSSVSRRVPVCRVDPPRP